MQVRIIALMLHLSRRFPNKIGFEQDFHQAGADPKNRYFQKGLADSE